MVELLIRFFGVRRTNQEPIRQLSRHKRYVSNLFEEVDYGRIPEILHGF